MKQAFEKHPSAALHSSFDTAGYSVLPRSSGLRAPCIRTFLERLRSRFFQRFSHRTRIRKARFGRGKSAGFTLLEVMVAVAVLGIAMTTIHYGQAQSIRAQVRTQNVTLATMKAMEKMEEILTSGRFELPGVGESEEGVFDPPHDFLHWTVRVEENAFAPQMIKDVYLTVSWDKDDEGRPAHRDKEGGGGTELEICMYVAAL